MVFFLWFQWAALSLYSYSCASYNRSAFENSVYCDTFHSEESGWRECKICRKVNLVDLFCVNPLVFKISLKLMAKKSLIKFTWQRLHCGCIASTYLIEILDFGGIGCTTCAKISPLNSVRSVRWIAYLNCHNHVFVFNATGHTVRTWS